MGGEEGAGEGSCTLHEPALLITSPSPVPLALADMVVYGLMPMWARLPANHFFSFLYVVVLSFMRGGDKETPKLEVRRRRTQSLGDG